MIRKLWLSFCYRWAMTSAYLTQEYSPVLSAHWITQADRYWLELWREEKS